MGLALAAQLTAGLLALGSVELFGAALGPRDAALMGIAAVTQGSLLVVVGLRRGGRLGGGRRLALAGLVFAAGLVSETVLRIATALGLSAGSLDGLAEAVQSRGLVGGLLLLGMVVLAPLGEELVFRGALWRALEPLGPRVALVVTSLCFSAVHLDPLHVIATLPLAFFLGWLRHVTGGLQACVLAHFLNNGLWWVSAQIGLEGPDPWIATPLALAALALAIWKVR